MTTRRTITRPMTTDPTLILSQWFSPSYPLGSFAYSHGMETAIQSGVIATAAQAEQWLGCVLEHGTGRTDAILLRAAFDCADRDAVEALDATARAYSASAERLFETTQQGAAFARTTADVWGIEIPALTHPVACGHAAGLLGLPLETTVAMYLQAFASNLVSCAVRLVPLGQTEGQAVLRRLTALCQVVAADTRAQGSDALMSSAFASDIAAMRHETLQHRIFRT